MALSAYLVALRWWELHTSNPEASIIDYFEGELESYEEALGDDRSIGPFELPVAPDRLHKQNVSGGEPYGLVLPDENADGVLAWRVPRPDRDVASRMAHQTRAGGRSTPAVGRWSQRRGCRAWARCGSFNSAHRTAAPGEARHDWRDSVVVKIRR